jgi:hypothetical protein
MLRIPEVQQLMRNYEISKLGLTVGQVEREGDNSG